MLQSSPSNAPQRPKWISRIAAIGTLLLAVVCSAGDVTSGPAPIATLAALQQMNAWDLHRPRAMSVEGTLTFLDPERGLIVVQAGETAAAIHGWTNLANLQVGDRIRVEAAKVFPTIPSVRGFPFAPATSAIIDSFDKTELNRPSYVDRFQGYVSPPSTGLYRFWISSDDGSELWLSDDEDPAHARKIASVPGWTESGEWTRYPSQQSQLVQLESGKRYYIEVFHDQGDGPDFVAIGWEHDGLAREVIRNEYLEPYPANTYAGDPAKVTSVPPHGLLRQIWLSSAIPALADLQRPPTRTSSFETEELSIVRLGHEQLPSPIRLKLGQPVPLVDDFRQAEITAEIRSAKPRGAGLDLELFDGENRMAAHVQQWLGSVPSGYRGYLVRLSGVCEHGFDAEGQRIPGTLWIQQLGELPVEGQSPSWNQVPPRHVSELTNLGISFGDEVPVRVRGRVVSWTSARDFVLQDEGSFSAYYSSDGHSWKQLGDEIHVPMRDPVSVGLGITSHGLQKTVARFDHVTGLNLGKGEHIGNGSDPGQFTSQNGILTLTGTGNDIWDWQDDFYFVHESHTGEGEFIAHLNSVEMHSIWAKAGLIVRESLAPDAPFVDIVNVGGSRLSLQWRLNRPHRATEAVYIADTESSSWLKLVRRHHTIPFTTLQQTSTDPERIVEVFGYLHRTATGVAIADSFVRSVETTNGSELGEDDRPQIEIRSLATWGRSSIPNYFRLRGVVTCNRISGNVHYFAVQDATGGVFVLLNNAVDRQVIQPGTLVDVLCDPIIAGRTTQAAASKVITIGRGAMPKPIPHPMELLDPTKGDGQWVEVDGIVYAAEKGGAMLRAAGSYVTVEASGMSTEDWSRLVDRRIRVQGVASDQHASGLKVLIPSPSYIEELGYDVPATASQSRSIADLSLPKNIADPSHREHIVGTVTFFHSRLAIVDDGTGAASVELGADASPVKEGDRVEAVGFPVASANGTLTLLHSTAHRLGAGVLPTPIRAAASAILDGTSGERLVTLEAEVVGKAATETGDVLDLTSDGRKFRAWCPVRTPNLESLREGSRIRLTGFAYHGPSYIPSDPIFTGDRERTAHFIVRSPEDIVFLQGPPWLRLKRALYILGALVFALLVVIVWAQVLRRRVKQRTEELNATLAELRRETEVSATLTERQRLAGEIHDSLEQGISGIMLQLESALQTPTCPAEIRQMLSVACNMVSFSHAEIRHAIWDLHSPVLEGKNLQTALKQMAQFVGERSPAVEVTIHGSPVDLSPEIEHHLLRVAQEAVTNAIKHAKASRIDVELEYRPDSIALRVKDDGCGFSTESHLADTTHFGLRSLRRRAKKMNARLNMQSRPGGGTVVEVVAPLARDVPV